MIWVHCHEFIQVKHHLWIHMWIWFIWICWKNLWLHICNWNAALRSRTIHFSYKAEYQRLAQPSSSNTGPLVQHNMAPYWARWLLFAVTILRPGHRHHRVIMFTWYWPGPGRPGRLWKGITKCVIGVRVSRIVSVGDCHWCNF